MIEKIDIKKIFPNPINPRLIKDFKFKKLVKSIKEFPEMLKLRPIVIDENNIILGGNMRYKACQEAGLKEIYVIQADDLTEKQKKEFIIKDNVGFGDWDWDLIANDWKTNELDSWGLDLPFDFEEMPSPEDLIGDEKDSKPSIKITFSNINDLESAELELKNILTKYKNSFYSVS